MTDPSSAAESIKEGPLEPNKVVEQVRQEPYDLHKDFQWTTVDVTDPDQVSELSQKSNSSTKFNNLF